MYLIAGHSSFEPAEGGGVSRKRLVWTRASIRRYDGRIVPTSDPLGRELFWFTVTPVEGAEEGTDRWAVVATAVSPPISSAEAAKTVREDEASHAMPLTPSRTS